VVVSEVKIKCILATLGVLRDSTVSFALLAEKQSKRLSLILDHAYRKVPYYRRLFDRNGISPTDIRSPADLRRLPITSRSDIQDLPVAERIPEGVSPDSMKGMTTSGSTGAPLEVRMSEMDVAVNDALTLRMLRHYGMKPWHSKMSVRGTRPSSAKEAWYRRLVPYRRGYLSASSSSEQWLNDVMSFRPDYIMGYPATLQLIARAVKASGNEGIRPRCIITTGSLVGSTARKEISDGLSAPVFDVYGSWEGGIMAWECEHCDGYHVNSDWVLVEILKDGEPAEPGEEGEVVITNLHSFGMPFIRYRQGDIAVRHEAKPSCGCDMPLLKRIYGRTTDILHLPDGRACSPHMALILMDSVPGIRNWRLTQLEPDLFRIEVAPTPGFAEETESQLRQRLRDAVKMDVRVEIVKIDDLPHRKDGKLHYVVSEVKPEQGETR